MHTCISDALFYTFFAFFALLKQKAAKEAAICFFFCLFTKGTK